MKVRRLASVLLALVLVAALCCLGLISMRYPRVAYEVEFVSARGSVFWLHCRKRWSYLPGEPRIRVPLTEHEFEQTTAGLHPFAGGDGERLFYPDLGNGAADVWP